jgi:hypothetical protein
MWTLLIILLGLLMAKLTLNTIGSRYGSIDALNDNSDLIETAFENTLSRDGTGPNNMESDLDMDSNRIINLNNGVHPQDAVTKNQLDVNKAEINALVQSLSTSPYGDAANVSYIPAGVSAVATTVQTKLRETVSVKDFGAVGDGVTDDTVAIQAAIDYAITIKGSVFAPTGVYLVTSPITLGSNITVYGEGMASTQFLANTDIEVFNSNTSTLSSAISLIVLKDFWVNKTVTGATTTFDIHLQNPLICTIRNVRVKSGHGDTNYSNTNLGGIWLDRPPGSTVSSFMNRIENCWIQNNSIYLRSVSDSVIEGGFVWGHTRQYGIRLNGCGSISVENIEGLIPSQYNGGIWLDNTTAVVNQIRISGNYFDGNPVLITGDGIYAPAISYSCTVTNNNFWQCGKNGVNITDPVGWTITGNAFWKNNFTDNFFDDVRITGVTFAPNGNVVSGNTFTIDIARTNKGYAIKEVNGGFAPTANIYTGNGIFGNTAYVFPAILVLGTASVINNSGAATGDLNRIPGRINGSLRIGATNAAEQAAVSDGQLALGPNALLLNRSADVAAAGTLDLTVNTDTFGVYAGGFAGILTVSAVRTNFAAQSTRTVYAVVAYGTTFTFTPLVTQNGTSGGSAFTLTMPSNGVIRFTDTSGFGNPIAVRMSFQGSKSVA